MSIYICTYTCTGHLERLSHLTRDTPASLQIKKVVQHFKAVGFKFGLNMHYILYQSCTIHAYDFVFAFFIYMYTYKPIYNYIIVILNDQFL